MLISIVRKKPRKRRLGLLPGLGPRTLRLVECGAPVPCLLERLALPALALLALKVLAPTRALALLRVRLQGLGCGHGAVDECFSLVGVHPQGTRHLVVLAEAALGRLVVIAKRHLSLHVVALLLDLHLALLRVAQRLARAAAVARQPLPRARGAPAVRVRSALAGAGALARAARRARREARGCAGSLLPHRQWDGRNHAERAGWLGVR
mmetsp:Transcript_3303/g.10302  ORF Transcript_3303/g.10302 Transcript_3303/m.10302 type:complete len:208 (-) Transcript_3303:83-706(-)